MLGAIIGDIVGSRFEFNNHRSTEFELFHERCNFTDDTICTIAVADWLIHKEGLPYINTSADTVKKYQSNVLIAIMKKWCRKYPNPMGGYGMSFRNWVFGNSDEPYNSYGNGSAMRVSPVAWANKSIFEAIISARESAMITHNHPEGIKGAEAVADMIFRLKDVHFKSFTVSKSVDSCMSYYKYENRFNCDQLRDINSFDETCMTAVPYSFQCLKESTDFESAIRLAVSIGGDSDTIAAITGSMAEAAYGIPDWMVEKAMTYLPDDMKQVINKFKIKFNYGNDIRRIKA